MSRNLKDKIPGAPNFTYGEFVKSSTATRLGIDNTPNEEHWKNIELLAKTVLQPIRNKFGRLRITSGYRSVALCEAIGSSSSSNHAKGQAADIEPREDGVTLLDIAKFIHDELDYRTIIAEYFPDGWVHVDYRVGGNLKRLKLKDKTHNYREITIHALNSMYS